MKMKIPNTYFRNVDLSTWAGVPICFGLLPMAGFCPSTLECLLPAVVMSFVLAYQHLFALGFKALVAVHACELVYALHRCRKLKLTTGTTVKWLLNVSLHGVFALRMLHWPEFYYNEIKKTN